jgi:hypothetical protein
MNDTVSDNPAQHRFELAVDGHVAASYYEIADGVITFVHTEVPPELGGKGYRLETDQGRAGSGASRGFEGDRAMSVRESVYRKTP